MMLDTVFDMQDANSALCRDLFFINTTHTHTLTCQSSHTITFYYCLE